MRDLVHKRLPAVFRAKPTWQQVANVTAAATQPVAGGEVAVALKMVLQLEGIPCKPQ